MDFAETKSEVEDAGKDIDELREGMRSVFEFDDEPQENNAIEAGNAVVKMRHKPGRGDNEEEVCFVQLPTSPNSNGHGKFCSTAGLE